MKLRNGNCDNPTIRKLKDRRGNSDKINVLQIAEGMNTIKCEKRN